MFYYGAQIPPWVLILDLQVSNVISFWTLLDYTFFRLTQTPKTTFWSQILCPDTLYWSLHYILADIISKPKGRFVHLMFYRWNV